MVKRATKGNDTNQNPIVIPRVPIKELENCEITVKDARKLYPSQDKRKSTKKNANVSLTKDSYKKVAINEGSVKESSKRQQSYFEPHKKQGILGVLRINKRNFHEAYVRIEGQPDLLILGAKYRNRGLDGDSVFVELLEGRDLEKAKNQYYEQAQKRFIENNARQEKVNLETQEYEYEPGVDRVFAKVVGIAKSIAYTQVHPGYLTVNRPNSDGPPNDKFLWFCPLGNQIPFMMVSKQSIPTPIVTEIKYTNKKLLYKIKIRSWDEKGPFPLGKYIGKLGEVGELGTESESLLVASGITWNEFDDKIIDSLVPTPWEIPKEEWERRIDMTKECVFSIDPPTAKDLDDGLSCEQLGEGKFRIGVHIADVSFFVRPNSSVDLEAFERGTSVYLAQNVIPMLPRLLCEELCSLNPGVNRLAFSVFWIFSNNGEIIGKPEFAKTVIKSCGKLWYEHAQQVIEDKEFKGQIVGDWSINEVTSKIKALYRFSQILRKGRFDNGALSLNSIKLWFKLDDNGNPIDTGVYEMQDSNRLIEEFMLLANMAVANEIANKFPDTALLRRHRPPVPESVVKKVELLNKCGFQINVVDSKALDESLKKIGGFQEKYIRLMLIKCMKRAEYFCTGDVELSEAGHYALSVPLYTHFTSPIRRYCDLVVHRQLEATFGGEELYNTGRVKEIAERCNDRKNQARDAQEASQNLFLCVFMRAKAATEMVKHFVLPATVVGVESRALDVIIREIGVEARVFLEDSVSEGNCTGVAFNQDDNVLMVRWKNGDENIRLFHNVIVKVWPDFSASPPRIICRALPPGSKLIHWNTAAVGKVLYPELDNEG